MTQQMEPEITIKATYECIVHSPRGKKKKQTPYIRQWLRQIKKNTIQKDRPKNGQKQENQKNHEYKESTFCSNKGTKGKAKSVLHRTKGQVGRNGDGSTGLAYLVQKKYDTCDGLKIKHVTHELPRESLPSVSYFLWKCEGTERKNG